MDKPGLCEQALKKSFQSIQWPVSGKVAKIVGNRIEAHLPRLEIGTLVELGTDRLTVRAEVVGFQGDSAILFPYDDLGGIAPGCRVRPLARLSQIEVNDELLGRVVDPFLQTIDDGPTLAMARTVRMPIECKAPNPMARQRIDQPLSIGVRAIDGVLSFGLGQRIGINAGSGVGKSVLLGMIANGSSADVNVIALIGERGREVKEFIQRELGPQGLRRSVVVVATSDQSPLVRIRGAKVATAIAEYFAERGKNVLLMMDSVTRVAMAQREVGNAIGEPPTTKGYTPSVFSLLPRLLERAGPRPIGHGFISAIYTVLVDGDNFNDPVADSVRSILDGHINLTRDLASKGHYPAIDITTSASRVMKDIVSREHWQLALKLKELVAVYNENKDLIQIGAYQQGADPKLDLAIQFLPVIEEFLKQNIDDRSTFADTLAQLQAMFAH